MQNPIANRLVVLREEFDDWAVLFNPDTGAAVGINPVGVFIWKQMDGSRSVGDIEQLIRSGFEEVPDDVSGQTAQFISDLADAGFVGYEIASDEK